MELAMTPMTERQRKYRENYRERVAGLSKMNSTKHTINLLRMCWKGFWQVQTYQPIPAATKRIEVERPGARGATNGKRVADVR